jgi:hypothetical protein
MAFRLSPGVRPFSGHRRPQADCQGQRRLAGRGNFLSPFPGLRKTGWRCSFAFNPRPSTPMMSPGRPFPTTEPTLLPKSPNLPTGVHGVSYAKAEAQREWLLNYLLIVHTAAGSLGSCQGSGNLTAYILCIAQNGLWKFQTTSRRLYIPLLTVHF